VSSNYNAKEIILEVREKLFHTGGKRSLKKIERLWGKGLETYEDVKEMPFYVDYLSKFFNPICDYEKEEDSFYDYDLLFMLIAGSNSSDWSFEYSEENRAFRLVIDVAAGERRIKKYLDDLFLFQLRNMYVIYLEEQINLDLLMREDKKERDILMALRQRRLNDFYRKIDRCMQKKLFLLIQGTPS